jgi:outer membrane protein OmpA-like peptidoglycan-associated protein
LIINSKTLDVLGSRLKEINNAELTITGTNDNKGEKKDKSLSLKRAEFAKEYIIKNFEINPDRINVKGVGLPEKASSSNIADGIEENRRIEFSSSNPKLLEPIILQSENQRLADPNLIEFVPYAESTDSIIKWKFEVYQGSKLLRTFDGTDEIKPIQWVIYPNELMNKQVPVDYNFTAETNRGIKKSANGTIPTEYYSITRKKSEDLPDKTISKYSLILFDFDKFDISDKDLSTINEYIIPAIKYNSIVKIYGYTDRIGEEKYNTKLAEKRALKVKEILESKVKSANFEVVGVGEGNFIYDNDLPTGRQLSRTVQVYVITPKQ